MPTTSVWSLETSASIATVERSFSKLLIRLLRRLSSQVPDTETPSAAAPNTTSAWRCCTRPSTISFSHRPVSAVGSQAIALSASAARNSPGSAL